MIESRGRQGSTHEREQQEQLEQRADAAGAQTTGSVSQATAGVASEPMAASNRTAPERPAIARPPRPEMSDRTPAPLIAVQAAPAPIRNSLWLWTVSLLVSLSALMTMLLVGSGMAKHVEALLLERDALLDTTKVGGAAKLIAYGFVAAVLVVMLIEWRISRGLPKRRGWRRLALLFVAILHLIVAGVAALLLPPEGWQGILLVITLLGGAALAFVAALLAMAPSVGRWLKGRSEKTAATDAADD